MHVEKFVADKKCKLSELLINKYYYLSYTLVQKMIRNRDVKINEKRISLDVQVYLGDEIIFYVKNELVNLGVNVVFQDNNIVVVNKPKKLEVDSDTGSSLLCIVNNMVGVKCYAVHRLDRNTQGLVVFAKNIKAKESLDDAFKNRNIHKYYYALVGGVPNKLKDELEAYLCKDNKNSLVKISDKCLPGYVKIQTNYRVIKSNGEISLLEVELITGKTHQIRAHLAFINCPIIGDEKYGISAINKKFNKKFQCLCSYKIRFDFKNDDYLNYLNGKVIELDNSYIDFLNELK